MSPVISHKLQAQRWTEEHANNWYASQPWLVGCNYIPHTAINQLEMWQAETFDPQTIDHEMGLAQDIGMNVMRIYLHDLVYLADPEGLKQRMDTVLRIADSHGIRVAFVIFDDCWNQQPQAGPQPQPQPGIHNSGWMQSPGPEVVNDAAAWPRLETYVRDIISTFADDERIIFWDIYNEPGNSGQKSRSLPLLQKAFEWARAANPSQPVTSGIWLNKLKKLNTFQVKNSDIITFHHYAHRTHLMTWIKRLKRAGRPLICTEWMARTRKSKVHTHLPIFKEQQIGCMMWGLVAGKTQTIYPWNSPHSIEPPRLWFHDLFYADGRPYKEDEIKAFKEYTGHNSEMPLQRRA